MVIFSTVWISCSKTKNTFLNRTGHNLSAHYNGYYNAGIKLEEVLLKLSLAHVDHFDRPLNVFPYGDAEKAKAVYPELEDIKKRTSTAIERHTMVDKRGNETPETEKWIDDNWVLYGKAQFFKRDYFEAIETFKYVEATYKKETGRHIASMWLAKTYLALTELRQAEEKLDYLRNQSDFPKKNNWELDAVNADYYLQTKNNEKAIQHLVRASVSAPDRENRIRYMFILAQLFQEKKEYSQAFNLYTKIIKMNPRYEMAFNARLNRARCYDSSVGSSESVYKELLKMEKDIKNKDFLDQIYYALAGLSKNEGKEADEIWYLNRSIASSTINQNQKALSYLELAKIYYQKPDYKRAQAYYDSTTTNLDKEYPDYPEILTRRNSLTRLVKNMKIIESEDSLQRLSGLSVEERAGIVDAFLSKEEEEAKKIVESEQQQGNQIFTPGNQTGINEFNKATGASWYFYNPQAVSFGLNEFVKKFGSRKLEDSWRRSKKEATFTDAGKTLDSSIVSTERPDTANIKDSRKRREEMMNRIPEGEEEIQKSNARIIEAYYNIGMIYREQLNDLRASVETFEELLQRFPENKYKLQSYYHLYRTYALMGNNTKSEYYKNIILNDYGDTEYAEIIRNPNYAIDKANRKSALDLFYEETYRKYLNGEYAAVISRKTEAEVKFPQNPLSPKFDFLKTLSIGRTRPLPAFEASLNDIIKSYPDDSVNIVAQEILEYIRGKGASAPANMPISMSDTSAANKKLYKYLPDTVHNVVLIFQNIGGPLDPDKLRNKLSDFNAKNFGSKSITLQEMLFDHRLKIFILKSFANKQEALQYTSLLFDNDDVFVHVNPDAYELYAVSVNNLPTLLTQKKTDKYDEFYRGVYK
jgi:tetratricopeptide (TPR) repeat protein